MGRVTRSSAKKADKTDVKVLAAKAEKTAAKAPPVKKKKALSKDSAKKPAEARDDGAVVSIEACKQ